MINFLRGIYQQTVDRMSAQVSAHAPGLLAGLLLLLLAYVLARLVRWVLGRIFKGIAFDRFLRQTGLGLMLDRSGQTHASEIVANAAFWFIFLGGTLSAISALDTELTNRITDAAVLLFPKLLAAGAIVVAGVWFGRYLGRHILVWAVNEGIPSGRRIAAAVRILVVFIAIAAAADHLDFARDVFLAALILVLGGVVLAGSIALGLFSRDLLNRHFQEKQGREEGQDDLSLWKHL
jgi:hypothetical protein